MKDFIDFFDVHNIEHIQALDYYLKNNFVWESYKNTGLSFIPPDVNLPTINDLRVIHEKMAQAWMEQVLANHVVGMPLIPGKCGVCEDGQNYMDMFPKVILEKIADEYLIQFVCGESECRKISKVTLHRFNILSNDKLRNKLKILGEF